MTARNYLLRAWRIDERIARRIEEREQLRRRLRAAAPERETPQWRRAQAGVEAMSAAIGEEIAQLCDVKREINAAIEAVEDERYKQLLELRYRNYMTWGAIAEMMDYELRHVYRLHRAALKRVDCGDGDGGRRRQA